MRKKKITLLVSVTVVLVLVFYTADMVRNWNELTGNRKETEEKKETVSLSWYINYSWFDGTGGIIWCPRKLQR